MLSPIPEQEIPNKYSKKLIQCKCSCGNPDIITIHWNTFIRQPTCGRCVVVKWQQQNRTKYGKLVLMCDLNEIRAMRQLVPWKCDCGTIKKIMVHRVVSGNTTTCGCAYSNQTSKPKVHQVKTIDEWKTIFPGLVKAHTDRTEWSRKANVRCTFACPCGRLFNSSFSNYAANRKCGKCNFAAFTPGHKIGPLTYCGDPIEVSVKSLTKLPFMHECGHRSDVIVRYMGDGTRTRCQQCNQIKTKDVTFGKLKIKHPKIISKYSTEELTWVCSCGNETQVIASNVVNGVTKSCGNCRSNVYEWWQTNQELIRSLVHPIDMTLFPSGGPRPLEQIQSTHKPFLAECCVCGNRYRPRLGGIKQSKSLTCGCSSNRISSGQEAVGKFLASSGLKVEYEYTINHLKYDLFVPEHSTLMEYNGLHWHSGQKSRGRDLSKYHNAVHNNYKFISIFEDEWLNKPNIIKQIICNRFGLTKPKHSFRPSKVEIKKVASQTADAFYEQHHYIGPCKASINYSASVNNNIVACVSFKHPSRQTISQQWELIRMASSPDVRIHGVWSKLLGMFVNEYEPRSIISFSDNRLFDGGVYGKLGFVYDGDVPPNYYWVKDAKRFHKSGLRKPVGETRTETELRISQGYKRIWDIGKKRWIWGATCHDLPGGNQQCNI